MTGEGPYKLVKVGLSKLEEDKMENAIGNAIHTVGFFCIGVILFYLADSIRKLKDVLKEYAKGGYRG